MMRRVVILAAFTAAVMMSTGCTTLIKQGYYGVTGAKGEFYELTPVKPLELAKYKSLTFAPFTSDIGPRVPSEVVREVNRTMPERVAGSHLFYPSGTPQLRVTGSVIHYTGAGGVVGAVSSIISSDDVCVCRVQLTDAQTGALVGEGVCWGAVKSAVRRGASEYGDGVGKGVNEWLTKRMPPAEREQRHEAMQAE
jgi:hypothetical protein